ncbi:reverse transcriptase domain-containing protein [Tanacetum coccineum]
MQKWSIQFKVFGLHIARVSVKGQVLADFIAERPEEEGQDDSAKEEELSRHVAPLFTNGSSYRTDAGSRCDTSRIPEGVEFTYALRFQFEATNNEAEYEALIAGLRIAEKIGIQNLEYLPSVLNKASPKKREQKSRCTKQNGIHQLCTSQQTGVGGGIERKILVNEEKVLRRVEEEGFLDDHDS